MKQLRDAIAQHVVEEETELFPKVLETDLDRYAVGAAAAARRTEQLFALASRVQTVTESPKETGMTPISKDEARQFFVVGLRNIHATATQCKTMVDAQLERLENYPVLEAKLQQHRIEKDQQLARVERILDGLGESRSSFKDTSMSLIGSISSMGAALADDEIFKNSFTTYGLANFEAAAYETLLLLGEAAEEYDAIPLLQESLSEERAMASFIASNLRPTGMRFLQLRSAQRQASH
jgi:ferritin-like metal-binding protein YciE